MTIANGLFIPYHGYFVSDLFFQNTLLRNIAIFVLQHLTDDSRVSGITSTNVLFEIPRFQYSLKLNAAVENVPESETAKKKRVVLIIDVKKKKTHTNTKVHVTAHSMIVLSVKCSAYFVNEKTVKFDKDIFLSTGLQVGSVSYATVDLTNQPLQIC